MLLLFPRPCVHGTEGVREGPPANAQKGFPGEEKLVCPWMIYRCCPAGCGMRQCQGVARGGRILGKGAVGEEALRLDTHWFGDITGYGICCLFTTVAIGLATHVSVILIYFMIY